MWQKVCKKKDIPLNSGACVKIDNLQIAIFCMENGDSWYAVQNQCPHQRQMVLSRGITGDRDGEPKITCPLHKNSFSLKNGKHLGGHEEWNIKTYGVLVEGDDIYLNMTDGAL